MDSFSLYPGILAACLQEISSQVRPAILGDGVSLWNVHGVHLSTFEGDRLPTIAGNSALLHLSRPCWMDSRFGRTDFEVDFQKAGWLTIAAAGFVLCSWYFVLGTLFLVLCAWYFVAHRELPNTKHEFKEHYKALSNN